MAERLTEIGNQTATFTGLNQLIQNKIKQSATEACKELFERKHYDEALQVAIKNRLGKDIIEPIEKLIGLEKLARK